MVLTVTLMIISQYILHGHRLPSVNSAKYLGVIIDSKLSFNEHIDSTCKKANSSLAFLCRNVGSCERKIKTDLYFTNMKPITECGVTTPGVALTSWKVFRDELLVLLCQITLEQAVSLKWWIPWTGPVLKLKIENCIYWPSTKLFMDVWICHSLIISNNLYNLQGATTWSILS